MTAPASPADRLAELRALLERAAAAGGAAELRQLRAFCEAFVAEREPDAAAGDDDVVWHGMVSGAPVMRELRVRIEKFARAASPVLIRGESGTGKEVVARILHELSPRAGQPMVSENCAAIPETLLESVLFGHARGSFTGAVRDHEGHFVAAHRGTLFLDEIGDTPLAMQAKLLRALQEGEIRPVGSEKVRKVDVRVLAATNRDLEEMVRAGRFRQDLFYRLNVLQLLIPPLRDRGDDILFLARRILAEAAGKAGRSLRLGAEAEAALRRFRWPGNVRQLQNELQRVAALAEGPVIRAEDLSPDLQRA
jgi:transcriptional regulator with GAF, ATPase, and Fis domain